MEKFANESLSKKIEDVPFGEFEEFLNSSKEDIALFSNIFNLSFRFEDKYGECSFESHDQIFSLKNKNIYLNRQNFYDKYKSESFSNIFTILKEEILREAYIIRSKSKYLSDIKSGNKKLWQIAYTLEIASYYGFTLTLNPSMLGLPDNMSANIYYKMLEKEININKSNDANFDSDSENESQNSEDRDNTQNGGKEAGDKEISFETDKEEGNKGASCEDNSNESKNRKTSPGDNCKENATENQHNYADENKEISYDDIEEYLRSNAIGNGKIEEIEKSLNSFESNFETDWRIPNTSHFKKCKFNAFEESIFSNIKKHINQKEGRVRLVGSKKEQTFMKYSWKTKELGDDLILYPGKKKISSNVRKRYAISPVVFFDFSGSTDKINKTLNNLLCLFNKENFIVCLYNRDLYKTINPSDQSFWCFPSGGGTNTLRAIKSFEEQEEKFKRNIYVVTDGCENHSELLENYPNSILFIIDQSRECLVKKYVSNGKIENEFLYRKARK